MKKKYFIFFLLVLISFSSQAQIKLTEKAEISIVTAGPGSELYEAFGHSAIRVKDSVLKLDKIYNYGVFDFNKPNFYTDFAKGNMIYSLVSYDFKYFIASYKRDKRWLKQQVLDLKLNEKQKFYNYLENNALPENKDYLYDPYFNNCATILKDITKTILKEKVHFNFEVSENRSLTFRDLTNNEISWNTWGSLGLNLIAGTQLDETARPEEKLFLPDYLYTSFAKALIMNKDEAKKLVKREEILLNFKENKSKIGIFNPFFIFSILAVFGLFITYKDLKNKKRTKFLDFILLFFTGLVGCILAFLWFFSTHSTAPNNFNLLWAVFPNIIVAFMLLKTHSKVWLKNYIKLLCILLFFIPFVWLFQIQVFPLAIIPLLVLLIVRFFYLSQRLLTFKI